MKRTTVIAATLGVAAAIPGIAAGQGAVAAGGQVQMFETPALNGTVAKVLITGAIGDYGRAIKINKADKRDVSGAYSRLVLHEGTIIADGAALQKEIQIGEDHAHINLKSCSLQGSVSAPVQIVSGTGAYAGITGTIKVTFTLAELGETYHSGPRQGQCNTKTGGPVAQFATVRGSGNVTFR